MSSRLKLAQREDSNLLGLYYGKLETEYVSAGPMQLNRLAAFGENEIAFASESDLFTVKYKIPNSQLERGRQGPCISRPMELELISCDKISSEHACEVQCLDINSSNMIASIDMKGGVQVKRLKTIVQEPAAKRRRVEISQVLPNYSQPGYCGCHWAKDHELVLTSHWQRKIMWWDVEKQTSTKEVRTWLKPNDCSMMYQSGSPLVGLAERNVLSVWDSRVQKKQGMVARTRVGPNPYWSVCVLKDNLFAIAGTDKVVSVIDSRKWSSIAGWRSGAKLELLKVCASPTKPELVYGAGRDNDLVCGEWHTKRKATEQGFGQCLHVNAPWAGVTVVHDKSRGREHMVGLTQKGTLYVGRDPYHLHLVRK